MQIEWGKVEAVILDLGGVILDIDYHKTVEAFVNLDFDNFGELYSQLQQDGLFDQLETGAITGHEFIKRIQEEIPHRSALEIEAAWNAIILAFPEGRLETLNRIKKQYRSFLLSNTNEIHLKFFNSLLHTKHGHHNLGPFFNKLYLSHEIQLRKPNHEAFEIILEEQGLSADQVLFVDDSTQHIESARILGMQAYHLWDGETLEELFSPVLT